MLEAKKAMQDGLTVRLGEAAPEAEKAGAAMDRLDVKVRRVSQSLKDQLAEWRKINAGGVVPGQQVSIYSPTATGRTGGPGATMPWSMNGAGLATHPNMTQPPGSRVPPVMPPPIPPQSPAMNWAAFIRNIGFSGLPLGAPTSPLALLASFRQSFQAFSTQAGQSTIAPLGLSGAGGSAMAAGGITVAAAAVGLALQGLRRAIGETVEAFHNAAQMYSRVLQGGGYAPGFVVQRSNIASVLGVSEHEVMRVGQAFGELAQRLSVANRAMTETMSTLAGTVINWRVMMTNIKALFAELATVFAPVANEVINTISAMAKLFTAAGNFKMMGTLLKAVLDPIIKTIEGVAVAFAALEVVLTSIMDAIRASVKELNNLLARWHMPGFTQDNSPNWTATKGSAEAFAELVKTFFGKMPNTAPNPVADMRRMVGSSWERMGLVIGHGGAQDYARKTAENTRKTVDLLTKLVNAGVARQGGGHMLIAAPNNP